MTPTKNDYYDIIYENHVSIIFLIFLLFGSVLSAQQKDYPRFVKQDYDTACDKVPMKTYAHGELVIKIINILKREIY